MKLIVAALALTLVVAINGSYLPASVVSYSTAVPAVTSSVWPAYRGLYRGKAAVTGYAAYPGIYGSWPLYGKSWGYPAAPVVTKVVDNGLWNYGGVDGGYNKHWQ